MHQDDAAWGERGEDVAKIFLTTIMIPVLTVDRPEDGVEMPLGECVQEGRAHHPVGWAEVAGMQVVFGKNFQGSVELPRDFFWAKLAEVVVVVAVEPHFKEGIIVSAGLGRTQLRGEEEKGRRSVVSVEKSQELRRPTQ